MADRQAESAAEIAVQPAEAAAQPTMHTELATDPEPALPASVPRPDR